MSGRIWMALKCWPRFRSNFSSSLSLLSLSLSLCFSLLPSDVRDAREQMHLGGVSYPTLPLQDASARPHSTFGQHSLACSPTGSFPGSFPPAGVLPAAQPHSSYFSGLTGPQHPFYNRVRHQAETLLTVFSKVHLCLWSYWNILMISML